MCKCKDIEIGSYDNQVELKAPNFMKNKKINDCFSIYDTICIDKCLEKEIISLWDKEIFTMGCCCGHNKTFAFIQVLDKDVVKMLNLGYVFQNEELNSFYPKTDCI